MAIFLPIYRRSCCSRYVSVLILGVEDDVTHVNLVNNYGTDHRSEAADMTVTMASKMVVLILVRI